MPEMLQQNDPAVSFKAAWLNEGKFLLQRCMNCRTPFFYPRPRCPACWSNKVEQFESAGRGIIVTETSIFRGLPDELAAEAPIILAEIQLIEGVTVIARVLSSGPVAPGMKVRIAAGLPRLALPTFEPQDEDAR